MTTVLPAISDRADELERLCLAHRVQRLDLFGSAVTGHYDPESSDLDFVVEFQPTNTPGARADAYFGLLEGLEELFGRPIDLVVGSAIRNPYFLESVDESRDFVYLSPRAASNDPANTPDLLCHATPPFAPLLLPHWRGARWKPWR